MILNYIFDLYGTLIDIHTDESMGSLWKRTALLLSLQGAGYSADELRTAYADAIRDQIEQRAIKMPSVGKAHIEPDILGVFASLYAQKGVSASHEQLKDTALFFRVQALRHIKLYPHAADVLRALHEKGKGVFLLSNAQAAFTVPELHMLGIYSLFDGIVLSSDVGIKKPDRAIFEHLLSKYGLHPETCLMIGNDEEADILGAASVGIAGRYIHTRQSPSRRINLPASCEEIHGLSELL